MLEEKKFFEEVKKTIFKKYKINQFNKQLTIKIKLKTPIDEYCFETLANPLNISQTEFFILEKIKNIIQDFPIYNGKIYKTLIMEKIHIPKNFKRNNEFLNLDKINNLIEDAFSSKENFQKYKNISNESIFSFLKNYKNHFFNKFLIIDFEVFEKNTYLDLNDKIYLNQFINKLSLHDLNVLKNDVFLIVDKIKFCNDEIILEQNAKEIFKGLRNLTYEEFCNYHLNLYFNKEKIIF